MLLIRLRDAGSVLGVGRKEAGHREDEGEATVKGRRTGGKEWHRREVIESPQKVRIAKIFVGRKVISSELASGKVGMGWFGLERKESAPGSRLPVPERGSGLPQ
jgi:hypothetical protein